MPRLSVVIAVLLVLWASHAYSQDQAQKKEPSPEAVQGMMDAMVPMMGRMTEVMLEAQLAVGERPETAERIAAFKRNL